MTIYLRDATCERCGYPRAGLGGLPCPECGWDNRLGGRWEWHRWPRLVRTVWIAGCPFVCHGLSVLGERFTERSLPIGLVASMLVIVSLLLLPVDLVGAWHRMHGEPVELTLRVWNGITLCYAILAVPLCGLMLVAPA